MHQLQIAAILFLMSQPAAAALQWSHIQQHLPDLVQSRITGSRKRQPNDD